MSMKLIAFIFLLLGTATTVGIVILGHNLYLSVFELFILVLFFGILKAANEQER